MRRVWLDTSFVLTALECGVDFFGELDRVLDEKYEACVLEGVLREVEGKKFGVLAKALFSRCKVMKGVGGENVDAQLLSAAVGSDIVATQDRKLKEKLKKRKIPVITIRQRKYLVLVE